MKRRDWMKWAGAGVVGTCVDGVTLGAASGKLPEVIVDTHTHFYDPTREGGVPWPQKGSPLFRTVLPDDWRAVAGPCGVKLTVVVEASLLVEDNQWILDLAAKDKGIVGFVGNLDPMAEGFAGNLERFASNPIFRGIRVSGKKFSDFAEDAVFVEGMKRLAALGLSLDVNGGHPMLLNAAGLAKTVPDLRIVIDHVGGAGEPTALKEEWKQGMKLAAEASPNVFCKVSGLPEQTKAEWGEARTELDFYRPILDWVWECFGEDRVVYGSNWPVSDKGTSYEKMFAIVSGYFAEQGEVATRKYFYENSLKAYRWMMR